MEENVYCYMSEASTNICTDRLNSLNTQTNTLICIHTQLTDTLCTDELTNIVCVQQLIQPLVIKLPYSETK